MSNFLRFGQWRALGSAAVLSLLLAAPAAAQCPIAAGCTPGNASSPQASLALEGIFNVTLGTINNTTLGYIDGYKDYSCTQNTALLVGQTYTLSVRTNSQAGAYENVVAWIDYSNDGQFTAGEQIMSSVRIVGVRTATFTVPTTAIRNTRLRMRVSADDANVTLPTACSTPQYSQVEDYSVTIGANSNPPVAAFTTNGTTTCTGCVQFTDASQNVPTSWSWNFGDGTPAVTTQSPSHCYTTPGTYNVTLTATNANGTNTTTATAITYTTAVPRAASCSPATTSYCCNYGVTRFRLSTIDNTSADGSVGYQDFTCPYRTSLTVGTPAAYTVTTGGTQAHVVRIYVDLNNDGTITSGEMVAENLNAVSPTGSISLPASTTTGVPLRLRIVADAVGNSAAPCVSPVSGQIEDYTIVAQPNTAPPVAAFTSNYTAGICQSTVQFTDQSTGAPTSWSWNFGDGSPLVTTQNPSHQYTTTGTYSVTLTVTNNVTSNAFTRSNYIAVTLPCFTYCTSNGTGMQPPGGGAGTSSLWLTSVNVSAVPANGSTTYPAFSNTSTNSTGGYGNYVNQTATLQVQNTHTLTAVTNLNFSHRTSVWIDYNRDGTFATQEMVINGNSTGGATAATYSATFTVPATAAGVSTVGTTRMRVVAALNNNAPNPCATNILNAEVEDYTVDILAAVLGSRAAQALPSLTVYPNPTPDGRLHLLLSDANATGTYTATVENLLGATLQQRTVRLSSATTADLELTTLPQGVYLLRLRNLQGQESLHRIVRE